MNIEEICSRRSEASNELANAKVRLAEVQNRMELVNKHVTDGMHWMVKVILWTDSDKGHYYAKDDVVTTVKVTADYVQQSVNNELRAAHQRAVEAEEAVRRCP